MKNLLFMQEKLIDSLFFAKEVANRLGTKVATLPDLVTWRSKMNASDLAWNSWITPLTTLYFGKYKDKRIIVVAHHLGSLKTKNRLEKWGESGSNGRGSDRKAYGSKGLPKISQREFLNLVEGKEGEVSIIDFDYYYKNFLDQLSGRHTFRKDILKDPLMKALCGRDFESFVEKHFEISSEYAREKNKEPGSEEKILQLNIKGRYGWGLFLENKIDFPKRAPVALFLTFGNPSYYGNHDLSVSTEISTHEDKGLSAFMTFNSSEEDAIRMRFSPGEHYKKCLVDSEGKTLNGLSVLTHENGKLFVEYPKEGNRMDTGEIMFPVIKEEKIGGPSSFKTTDCRFFLKYHLDEVKAVMPSNANAYEVIGDVSPGDIVDVPIQFYKIEADTSKRILRRYEVMKNLPLLLEINGVSL